MHGAGFDASQGFSTPFDAPLVPSFPFAYRDVWILTAIYRTDAAATRRVVPEPLECDSDLVVVHIYQMNDTEWFGRYNESAVQIPVRLGSDLPSGVYSPYLLLDHDGAIAAGREVYGQPKKYGRPTIDIRMDLVVGAVERNGIDIVSVTTPYKQTRAHLDDVLGLVDFRTNVNLKVIPAADTSDGIRELTSRTLDDVVLHEAWSGPGTVELRANAQVPVHLLPVRQVLGAWFWNCDFVLGPARSLLDYTTGERVVS